MVNKADRPVAGFMLVSGQHNKDALILSILICAAAAQVQMLVITRSRWHPELTTNVNDKSSTAFSLGSIRRYGF